MWVAFPALLLLLGSIPRVDGQFPFAWSNGNLQLTCKLKDTPGWIQAGSDCYLPYQIRGLQWSDANSICSSSILKYSYGTPLQNWLIAQQLSTLIPLDIYWTGLQTTSVPDLLDNHPESLTTSIYNPMWASGEPPGSSDPNSNNSVSGCIALDLRNSSDIGWRLVNCSHRLSVLCQTFACVDDQFRCDDNSRCVPRAAVGDSISDCRDGSDEATNTITMMNAISRTTSNCRNVLLTSSAGEIVSPGYPSSYPLGTSCMWTIKTTDDKVVVLNTESILLTSSDYLTMEGNDPYDSLSFSAHNGPLSYVSRSNTMKIVFKTNGTQTDEGFRILYQTIDKSSCPIEDNQILYDSWRQQYDCIYNYVAPNENDLIMLKVESARLAPEVTISVQPGTQLQQLLSSATVTQMYVLPTNHMRISINNAWRSNTTSSIRMQIVVLEAGGEKLISLDNDGFSLNWPASQCSNCVEHALTIEWSAQKTIVQGTMVVDNLNNGQRDSVMISTSPGSIGNPVGSRLSTGRRVIVGNKQTVYIQQNSPGFCLNMRYSIDCPQLLSSPQSNLSLDSLATFTCLLDEIMKGSATAKCLLGGTWSSQPPICSVDNSVHCTLPIVLNGYVSNITGYTNGSKLFFECAAGYLSSTPANMSTCSGTGIWNPEPSCTVVVCSTSPSNYRNATLVTTDGSDYMDTANYTPPVYASYTNPYRICTTEENQAKWLDFNFGFQVLVCYAIPVDYGHFVKPTYDNGTYGEVQCIDGFMTNDTPRCINGQWNIRPSCTNGTNASIPCENGSIRILNGNATCQCFPGYKNPLNNQSTCEDIDECHQGASQCDSDSTCQNTEGSYNCTCAPGKILWNGSPASPEIDSQNLVFSKSCIYNYCDERNISSQGNWTQSEFRFYRSGTNATFYCISQAYDHSAQNVSSVYTPLSVKCDGPDWDSWADPCQKHCPPADGSLTFVDTSYDNSALYSRSTLKCKANDGSYRQLIGQADVMCLLGGTWSNMPLCAEISCPSLDLLLNQAPNLIYNHNVSVVANAIGDVLSFSCNDGTELLGASTIHCISETNAWLAYWSGPPPICVPIPSTQIGTTHVGTTQAATYTQPTAGATGVTTMDSLSTHSLVTGSTNHDFDTTGASTKHSTGRETLRTAVTTPGPTDFMDAPFIVSSKTYQEAPIAALPDKWIYSWDWTLRDGLYLKESEENEKSFLISGAIEMMSESVELILDVSRLEGRMEVGIYSADTPFIPAIINFIEVGRTSRSGALHVVLNNLRKYMAISIEAHGELQIDEIKLLYEMCDQSNFGELKLSRTYSSYRQQPVRGYCGQVLKVIGVACQNGNWVFPNYYNPCCEEKQPCRLLDSVEILNYQTCSNGQWLNSTFCNCNEGFTLNTTSIQCVPNHCNYSYCSSQGTCNPSTGKCVCHGGYTGSFCEISPYSTENNCTSCSNGTCLRQFNDMRGIFISQCICGPDWTGADCSCPINHCLNNNCANPSTCKSQTGPREYEEPYTCQCDSDHYGSFCTAYAPCTSGNDTYKCPNGGTCNATNGACTCATGWSNQDNCAVPQKYCNISVYCGDHGTCFDYFGGGFCKCDDGYTGNLCETLMNCTIPNACQQGYCSSGTFQCVCDAGWTGTYCSEKLDACIDNTCHADSTCTSKLGGPTCSCDTGYFGNICEKRAEYCIFSPCFNGNCTEMYELGYNCTCDPGYSGDNCEITICSNNLCINGGTCVANGTQTYCHCPDGYTGQHCETDLTKSCQYIVCQHNGTCISDNNDNAYCMCDPAYTGEFCETEKSSYFNIYFNGLPSNQDIVSRIFPALVLKAFTLCSWVQYAPSFTVTEKQKLPSYLSLRLAGSDGKSIFSIDNQGVVYDDDESYRVPVVIPVFSWHHICVRSPEYDDPSYKPVWDVFLDGVKYANMSYPPIELQDNTNCLIQLAPNKTNRFQGEISLVQLYATLLNETSIAQMAFECEAWTQTQHDDLHIPWNDYTTINRNNPGAMTIYPGLCKMNCVPGRSTCNTTDKIPPVVTNCPSDIRISSPTRLTSVNWNTTNMFRDNVGVTSVTSNFRPGQAFSWGYYRVTYIGKDAAGNSATCSFSVVVAPSTCAPLDKEQMDGHIEMKSNDGVNLFWTGNNTAYVTCNSNDFPNMTPRFFTCDAMGQWERNTLWPNQTIYRLPGCASTGSPTQNINGTMTASGDCEEVFDSLNQTLWNATSPYCEVTGTCLISIFPPKTHCQNNRMKREVDQMFQYWVQTNNTKQRLQTQLNSSIRKTFPKGTNENTAAFACDEKFPQEAGSSEIFACAGCAAGMFWNNSTTATSRCEYCPMNTYRTLNASQTECVPCTGNRTTGGIVPAVSELSCYMFCDQGEFYSKKTEFCQQCELGWYQPNQGALTCLICPQGLSTTSKGSKAQTDCIDICKQPGTEMNIQGTCSNCSLGTYKDSSAPYCQECPLGLTTLHEGSTGVPDCNVIDCPADTYVNTNMSMNVQYTTPFELLCLTCGMGTYQDLANQTYCKNCTSEDDAPTCRIINQCSPYLAATCAADSICQATTSTGNYHCVPSGPTITNTHSGAKWVIWLILTIGLVVIVGVAGILFWIYRQTLIPMICCGKGESKTMNSRDFYRSPGRRGQARNDGREDSTESSVSTVKSIPPLILARPIISRMISRESTDQDTARQIYNIQQRFSSLEPTMDSSRSMMRVRPLPPPIITSRSVLTRMEEEGSARDRFSAPTHIPSSGTTQSTRRFGRSYGYSTSDINEDDEDDDYFG